MPEFQPAWHGFTVDPDGGLWVVANTAGSARTTLDAFDPEGRFLGRVVLDTPIRPAYPGPVIRDGQMYAVSQDELGVAYVIRAPLGGVTGLESVGAGSVGS